LGRQTTQARSEVEEFLRHERESIRAVAKERERAALEQQRLNRQGQREAEQFAREEQRREQQRIRQAQQSAEIRRRFEATKAAGAAGPSRSQVERAFTSAARETDQLFRGVETKARKVEQIFAGAGGGGISPAVRKAGADIRRHLIQQFDEASTRARNFAKIVGGITLGGIVFGVGTLVKEAFEINKQFERYRVSLESILAITNNVVDANGKIVTGTRAFDFLGRKSAQLFQSVRKEAAQTILEFPELIQVFSENLGNAVQAGLSIDKNKKGEIPALQIVSRIAQLAKTQGLIGGERQLSQEVRALLTGQGLQAATVAKILGLTQKQIEQAIEQGKLQDLLNEKLKDAEPLVRKFADSFEGVVSTLKSQGQEILRKGFERTFERITVFLRQIRDQLTDEKIDEFADKIADFFVKLFEIGKQIAALDPLGKIKTAFEFIVRNQAVIGGVLAGFVALKTLGPILGGLLKTAEALKQLNTAGGFLSFLGKAGFVGRAAAVGAGIGTFIQDREVGRFEQAASNTEQERQESLRRPGGRLLERRRRAALAVREAQGELRTRQQRLTDLAREGREEFGRRDVEVARRLFQRRQGELEAADRDIRSFQIRRDFGLSETGKAATDDLRTRAKETEITRERKRAREKERIEAKKALAEAIGDKHGALRAQFELDKLEINETVKNKQARNIKLQALEITLRDAEKKLLAERQLQRLNFEKETAERQGQFRRAVGLDLKAEEVQSRELLRHKEIDLKEFNARRVASERDAGKKIRDERFRLEKDALDIATRFSDAVREQQKRRLDFRREIAEKEKQFAKDERAALFGIVDAQNAVTDAIRKRNELQEDAALRERRRGVQSGLRQLLDEGQPGARSVRDQLQGIFERQVRGETGNQLTREQDVELATQRVEEFIDRLTETITGPGGVGEALRILKETGVRTVSTTPGSVSLGGELAGATETEVGGVAISPQFVRRLGALGVTGGRLNRQEQLTGEIRQARNEALELTGAGGDVAEARTRRQEAVDGLKELRDEFTRTRQELVENFQKETRDAGIALRDLNREARNFLQTLLQGDIAISQSLVGGVRAATGAGAGIGGFIGPPVPAGIRLAPEDLLTGAQSQLSAIGGFANSQAATVNNATSSNFNITINGHDATGTVSPRAKSLLKELEDELTRQSRRIPVK